MFDNDYINGAQPQHVGIYDCGCVRCELWRRGQLKSGDLVKPIKLDPVKVKGSVNGICLWDLERPVTWWSEIWHVGIFGVFIRFVPKNHQANYVNGCVVRIFNKNGTLGKEKCCRASDLVVMK